MKTTLLVLFWSLGITCGTVGACRADRLGWFMYGAWAFFVMVFTLASLYELNNQKK